MEINNYSEADLERVAQELLDSHPQERIFAFEGDMGVGKTTLINVICRKLGVDEHTSSPTFSLVNEYETSKGTVYHMDFYRLEDPQEAVDIGIDYYFDSNDYCFIEWPSKIEELLPHGVVKVFVNLTEGNLRNIRTELE